MGDDLQLLHMLDLERTEHLEAAFEISYDSFHMISFDIYMSYR
jgi:hypothetical protein